MQMIQLVVDSIAKIAHKIIYPIDFLRAPLFRFARKVNVPIKSKIVSQILFWPLLLRKKWNQDMTKKTAKIEIS